MHRAAALAALIAVGLAPAALAQTAPEEPVAPTSFQPWVLTDGLPEEGAPRSTPVTGSTVLGLQTSYVGRKAAEPTMGVDSKGRAFYAAGDFDGTGGTTARTEIFRSTDGGLSFQEVTPQVGGVDVPPTTLDPYVYVDQRTDRVFSIDLEALAGSYLAYSDDAGTTWSASAMAAPGVNDHQTFFTGPPSASSLLPPSLTGYPTVAYYCVNALVAVTCSRSTDGGVTFQPLPSAPFSDCAGCQTGHGVVDSQGRVFLPKGAVPGTLDPAEPQVAVSEDGGGSWRVTNVAGRELQSGSRHTAVAVDAADNVYYVWYDATYQLPWMAVSTDHGRTFGEPMMVAPPGVHDANFPMVAAGDEGRVAISFPGSSVDAPNDATRPWHAWVMVTEDALASRPTFHAAPADDGSDPLHRGVCNNRCSGMYDFIDLQVSPLDGSAWATFTDTCTSLACRTQRRSGVASDAQGVAVRTVAGPSLRAPE